MKKYFLILFLLISVYVSAQTIVDKVIQIEPKSEESFTFPAKEKDQLHIFFERIDGKKISKVMLYNAKGEVVYMRYDVKKLEKTVELREGGIYKLVFINKERKLYKGTFKVAVEAENKKPRRIAYERVIDTSYGYETIRSIRLKSLATSVLQNDKFYLNSKSNALVKGGKNRVVLPISIPENTKEWYYVYSASRNEEQINQTLNSFNLAAELTTFIEKKNSLKQSVVSLSAPPGANISDIYLLNDKNAKLFQEKEKFTYELDASRENFKSGIVHVSQPISGKVYLGINNPDNLHGIHVGIEVVAIVENESLASEMIRIPVYTSYNIPVLIEE